MLGKERAGPNLDHSNGKQKWPEDSGHIKRPIKRWCERGLAGSSSRGTWAGVDTGAQALCQALYVPYFVLTL